MPDGVQNNIGLSTINCTVIIHRVMLRRKWVDPDSNAVLPDAYLPRPNGNDDDGLSVVLSNSNIPENLIKEAEQIAEAFKKTFGDATLHTGRVRDISGKLNVVHDPLDEQPNHALLSGVPRQDQDLAEAERLAGQLARISRLIWVP